MVGNFLYPYVTLHASVKRDIVFPRVPATRHVTIGHSATGADKFPMEIVRDCLFVFLTHSRDWPCKDFEPNMFRSPGIAPCLMGLSPLDIKHLRDTYM